MREGSSRSEPGASQPLRVAQDGQQKLGAARGVGERAVEQGFGVGLDHADGGAQLVRDVGHEIAPHLLQAAYLADIEHHQDRCRLWT
jgi:hypothetical protein